jgi:hypothetical protein
MREDMVVVHNRTVLGSATKMTRKTSAISMTILRIRR